jgi:flavin reductase (DIM6/NTAB) family NADH-FMN oxidoreductase RutF
MMKSGANTTDSGLVHETGPAGFRSLMSTFPTGVAIVTTTGPDGKPWGMTCSTVCSVAVDPPTLLICLRESSPTLLAMVRTSTFAVNLLHEDGRHSAELFASGAVDRFDRVRWRDEPPFGGPHLIDAAHATADCKITRTLRVGDHVVVFGEVLGIVRYTASAAPPLLYGFRQYSSWSAVAA